MTTAFLALGWVAAIVTAVAMWRLPAARPRIRPIQADGIEAIADATREPRSTDLLAEVAEESMQRMAAQVGAGRHDAVLVAYRDREGVMRTSFHLSPAELHEMAGHLLYEAHVTVAGRLGVVHAEDYLREQT